MAADAPAHLTRDTYDCPPAAWPPQQGWWGVQACTGPNVVVLATRLYEAAQR